MTLATRLVQSALAAVGLSADTDPIAYGLHLGGPGETPQMCHDMACFYNPKTGTFSSTCGLEIRAQDREAGVDDRRCRAPYHNGSAITDRLAIAEERDALTTLPLTGHYPAPELHFGDMVGVDCDPGHRDGHVYRVVTEPVVNADGTITFDSVDGGHGQPGHQATVRRTKTIFAGAYGGWYDRAADGGPERRVTHVVSAARLETGGPMVPCVDADPADSSLT